MRGSHDELKTDLLSVLEAGRELSPSNDDELAEIFLSRWEAAHPTPRWLSSVVRPSDPTSYALLTALALLIGIPIVMIVQTYSALDGYLPPLDAGALPAVYWLALAMTVLLLVVKTAGRWMGWHVQLLLQRSPR